MAHLAPFIPLGTTGITELDMDFEICITLRVVKAFPLIVVEQSQRRLGYRWSTSFPKSMFYDTTVTI